MHDYGKISNETATFAFQNDRHKIYPMGSPRKFKNFLITMLSVNEKYLNVFEPYSLIEFYAIQLILLFWTANYLLVLDTLFIYYVGKYILSYLLNLYCLDA